MNKKMLLAIVLLVLPMVFSCARIPVGPAVPYEAPAARQLFDQAEKHYRSGALDSALDAYGQYLARYPGGLQAPAVLIKMGSIYEAQGRAEEARKSYDRLIRDFPQNPLAGEARVKWLSTYDREQDYGRVIETAPMVLENLPTQELRFKAYMLLARAHLETGDLANAVPVLGKAYPLGDDQQKTEIAQTVGQILQRLSLAEIDSLLSSQRDDFIRSALLYRLGAFYLEQERYEEALAILEQFLQNYPQHPDAPGVQQQVAALQGKAGVERFAVGCLLPLSGPYAKIGQKALEGVELAFTQLTAAQGDSSLKLVIRDSGGDPKKAAAAVKALSEQQVAAIIGPIVAVEAAAAEAQSRRIPMIALTQKEGISQIGDFIFRNFITPQMQVKRIVSYAVERLGARRFAIFYPREKYGTTFMKHFWEEVIARGGRMTGAESYQPGQTDFADDIKKLVGLYYPVPESLKPIEFQRPAASKGKENRPRPIIDFDVLFIPDAPASAGLIIPQLAYYDVKDIYLFGTNLWHSPQLIKMAGQYAQGAMMPDGFFVSSWSPAVKAFASAFQSTFNRPPGFIEAAAYDSAMLLLTVIGKEGVRFKGALKERLLNIHPFPGVTGLTRFSSDGDAQKTLYLLQVKGDGFTEIEDGTESLTPLGQPVLSPAKEGPPAG